MFSLRKFTNPLIQRIPAKIKIVAEIRLMWEDIVGEGMANRSQPIKCELIPKKDEDGQNTGEFYQRLVVNVLDPHTKTAMTNYSANYLDRVPKRHRIHSMRFQQGKVNILEPSFVAQTPIIEIPHEDRERILQKVQILPEHLQGVMAEYLIVCKYQQNKNS